MSEALESGLVSLSDREGTCMGVQGWGRQPEQREETGRLGSGGGHSRGVQEGSSSADNESCLGPEQPQVLTRKAKRMK